MEVYRYETHLHTAETSLCGRSSGAEFASYLKSLGYTGVFVTDHFLNGNTRVPQDIPWSDRVELFCRGYDVTAEAGKEVGLDVFFGWEYSNGWAHFLTYGLGKEWLLDNPDLLSFDPLQYFDRVHQDGGAVVHAHPFREGVDIVQLVPDRTVAVEVVNSNRTDEANQHALDYADSFGLPKTAGSDIHSVRQRRLSGVTCRNRFESGTDYIDALTKGELLLFDQEV